MVAYLQRCEGAVKSVVEVDCAFRDQLDVPADVSIGKQTVYTSAQGTATRQSVASVYR